MAEVKATSDMSMKESKSRQKDVRSSNIIAAKGKKMNINSPSISIQVIFNTISFKI